MSDCGRGGQFITIASLRQRDKDVIYADNAILAEANEKEMQEIRKAVEEKEKKRKEALEKKQEELDKKYDAIGPRRAIVEAQTAVAGTRSHLVIGWLGRLLLLLGLLVLTVQSEGVRQKVILIVLLVVMFSALSGVNPGFQAQGASW